LRRRPRKQKVVLRPRRREQLKHFLERLTLRAGLGALVVVVGIGLFSGEDSAINRFIHRHTPVVEIKTPSALAGLPILAELPAQKFWLWSPGSAWYVQRRILARFPVVKAVRWYKDFQDNRVVVRLEPRIPLVVWRGFGIDAEGRVFPITPGVWSDLPQADFSTVHSPPKLGRWLAQVSSVAPLWKQVTRLHQDHRGQLQLQMKTGAQVLWGEMEPETATERARTLARVLEDAHQHLGGAALADLRFFDEERIIVMPKTAAIRRLGD
jgi:hypothetical protein